jgi:hypothetical protein
MEVEVQWYLSGFTNKASAYGLLQWLTERMYQSGDGWLEESEMLLDILSDETGWEREELKSAITRLVSAKIFTRTDDRITAERVQQNIRKRFRLSERRAESGRKGAIVTNSSRQLLGKSPAKVGKRREESRGEEIRGDERREHETSTLRGSLSEESARERTAKMWPPAGEEVVPHVFLTPEQKQNIRQQMSDAEAKYWLREMSETAEHNLPDWKKRYSDHQRVLKKWRLMKLEKGFVWNEQKRMYEYPQRSSSKAMATANLERGVEAVRNLEEMERQHEAK